MESDGPQQYPRNHIKPSFTSVGLSVQFSSSFDTVIPSITNPKINMKCFVAIFVLAVAVATCEAGIHGFG